MIIFNGIEFCKFKTFNTFTLLKNNLKKNYMKKIYFLAMSLVIGFSANAQLTEDFETYPLGSYFGGHWTNWSGTSGAENLIVSNDVASSGVQSGFIGNDEIQDPILDVGMKTSGLWTYSMDIYIDFGASGYFNAQHDLASLGTTGNWAYQCYIGIDPTQTGTPPLPGMFSFATAGTAYQFPYNEEEWFNIALEHDIDNDIVRVYMNGELLSFGTGSDLPFGDDPIYQGKLNGFNYYSASAGNSMYFDNIKFYEGPLGVSDVSGATISVYPTVVKDNVNISAKSNITNIAVFNTAGQQVLKSSPNSATTQVNMSALPSGVYIVKIQAGKETLTKKVVVK